MDLLVELFQRLNSLEELIRWGGYLALVAIVFAETGLLIGFFLPGDSLLVTAGLLASTGTLDIWLLNGLLSVAAVAGDSVGYYIGHTSGPRIFTREKSFLFARDHLIRTKKFYERHGGKTIVIARFVPIIRTFAPVVAGVGQMAYRRFVSYNVFGGIFWVGSTTLVGYFLGRTVPGIQDYLPVVIAIVVGLSILPGVREVVRARLALRRRLSAEGPH